MARFIFLFLAFLILITNVISICNGNSVHAVCIEGEKEALLKLKQGIVDRTNRLASWVSDGDCCGWTGIVCDNMTGHVIELHLRTNPPWDINYHVYDYEADEAYERSRLDGKISPSLLHLNHLSYLDLSNNDFGGIHIPKFFGSLGSLRYLNLSRANFGGEVPHHLGNLSNLKYLNLGNNYYHTMYVENLYWLSSLSSLEYLDLSYVNLSQASNWFHALNTLSSLVELHLSYCQLPYQLYPINLLTGRIPPNIGDISSLESLDLSVNKLLRPIPKSMSRLSFLSYLNLSGNQLIGKIPSNTQLQSFDASCYVGNELCGLPLMENCNKVNQRVPGIGNNGGKDMDLDKVNWLFISMALGFILGFWSVLGPLVISSQWRYAYYQYLDEMWWKSQSLWE
ncbi:hypothetical protein SLEP1_g26000 [Rubroshorea leprosula]|uniref:Leucine-rich repeat-containing N-terminal plant-type domain-containing protein n=1 Tax=Rubroshorea leprosula TaxID=152421 RepID=A0AAV5JV98_9ROSI|nr:hypothetical protein SLEP1_g26000 [Rubroshorea leprosula]